MTEMSDLDRLINTQTIWRDGYQTAEKKMTAELAREREALRQALDEIEKLRTALELAHDHLAAAGHEYLDGSPSDVLATIRAALPPPPESEEPVIQRSDGVSE